MKIALHWFRRDLRITDNTSLRKAWEGHDQVWPVFIFDPKILQAPDTGAARVRFLLDSLEALQKNLEHQGSRLIIRQGEAGAELFRLAKETGAQTVFWNRDYEPYARKRDALVTELLRRSQVDVRTYKDGLLWEPDEVLKADGAPYTVFTPFAKLWRTRVPDPPAGLAKFQPISAKVPSSEPLPTLQQLGFSLEAQIPRGGERSAVDRLARFVEEKLVRYQSLRNFPAQDGTSQISADLRFGTLSPRQVYQAAVRTIQGHPEAKAEVEVFQTELIWREFYRSILWHFPHVAERSFKIECEQLPWENNDRYFAAWCEGKTGYPLVDAAMRQLHQTGWMHNRLRMVVASFLTKDLLIDYKWGERYFMQKLVDGDLASNNGGWQWSASTGTDAQPYFRVFNPASQAEKFDPEGRFIERFLPEANNMNYPPPIVDHGVQREKAIRMFKHRPVDSVATTKSG